jgi:cytochrome c553
VIIKTKLALTAVLALIAGAASAQGNPEAGETIGYSCLGCHGIEGYRNAYPSYRVPKLGGQSQAYLVVALKGYRSGTRAHPTMIAQATSLSDQQIEDVAAYLASLAEPPSSDNAAAPGIPPQTATCVACHGQNGVGLSPTWPTIAGQHEDYIIHALEQYRAGKRNDPVMMPMAANLTDDDIKVLADYYSNLQGLVTTHHD